MNEVALARPNPPAPVESGTIALPLFWRVFFIVELPLVGGTVGYWLLAPGDYLSQTLGIEAASPEVVHLLWLYAGVVASLVFWFYLRLLASARIHLRTFRLYQEALLVGDVWIVAVGALMLRGAVGDPTMAAVQIGMATFWGLVRVVFLRKVRQ